MSELLQIPNFLPAAVLDQLSDRELGPLMLLFYAGELGRGLGLTEIDAAFVAAVVDKLQKIDGDYAQPATVQAEKILSLAARGEFERSGRLARASIEAAHLEASLASYARGAYAASSERRAAGGRATATKLKEEAASRYEKVRTIATDLLLHGREPQNIVSLIAQRVPLSKPTIRKALETHTSGNWAPRKKKDR